MKVKRGLQLSMANRERSGEKDEHHCRGVVWGLGGKAVREWEVGKWGQGRECGCISSSDLVCSLTQAMQRSGEALVCVVF